MVMGGDLCSEGRGFESLPVYWMDILSHRFVVKVVMMFVWKDRK